jgi:sterol 3beta-glucosyltransferase
MNILIFTFGSRGDVQPYVALGAALRKNGHNVIVSTGQGFEAMIEAHGLTAAPSSMNYRELIDTPEAQAAFRSMSGKFRAMHTFKHLVRRQFEEMWDLAREVQPDLLLYHPKGFLAQDIAEALDVIAVPTTLQPSYVPTGAFPNPFLPFLDLGAFGNRLTHHFIDRLTFWAQSSLVGSWRQDRLGLSGDPSIRDFFAGYHPQGYSVPRLHGYSGALVPRPHDWTERERITGYWLMEPNLDWQPPQELSRFLGAGPPPVYVGFGSMPASDVLTQTSIVIEALRRADQRGVLATGWGGLQPTQAPHDGIHFVDAVPHDWLFPRCSAVVHHGGAGTTHEGLRWGRPTIICPLGVDQPYWGRLVNALGAGPPPLPQKRLNSHDLAEAIGAALRPSCAHRAAQLGDAIRAEGGAATAAAVLEDLDRSDGWQTGSVAVSQ